ncbi:MAG TPA: nitroreductase [Spongiibacteraceae bacterium]|nr:nitroreductase [Spongiibacteraceae bacterium]
MTTSIEMMAVGASMPAQPLPALLTLLASRRSSSAGTLTVPAPDGTTLRDLLRLATHTPDHGKLSPWRFIVLEGAAKNRFVERLEILAGAQENSTKALAALAKIRNPPLSVAVISAPVEGKIPLWEQQLSVGAVCMSLLLAAHAAGFGANWITDWYAYDEAALALLGVTSQERVAGYIHIGTQQEIPKERPRAELDNLISDWSADAD